MFIDHETTGYQVAVLAVRMLNNHAHFVRPLRAPFRVLAALIVFVEFHQN